MYNKTDDHFNSLTPSLITFETAFVECERLIFSIANKLTCKRELQAELVQEGYLGLYRAVELFDLRYNVKFSTFAYGYIKGYMQKFLFHTKRDRAVALEFDENLFGGSNPDILDEIDLGIIKEQFHDLTPKQAQIINLYFIQDLSVTEIANRLSISKQRVSTVINNVSKNIKKNLN
jgi:RNA polymerase sporulation-specific sigma factor